ncbi:hypothetical protein, partial [Haemophilus parainfluenzae]|uniref:hypothetical protein n=1 Tax=Haemophilus parainfluenzae TaxID=729 RepID=UPI001CEC8A81
TLPNLAVAAGMCVMRLPLLFRIAIRVPQFRVLATLFIRVQHRLIKASLPAILVVIWVNETTIIPRAEILNCMGEMITMLIEVMIMIVKISIITSP